MDNRHITIKIPIIESLEAETVAVTKKLNKDK